MSITKKIPTYSGTVPDKDAQTPSEFNDAADAYVDWYSEQPDHINEWANQANSTADAVNTDKNAAEIARTGAETAETNAETARDYANDWATGAEDTQVDDGVNPAGYSAYHWAQKSAKGERLTATSSSSVTVGTGSKTFTLAESYRAFTTGSKVRAVDGANPVANYMEGTVTSYDDSTDELVVDVVNVGGSGTIGNWYIGLDHGGDASTLNGYTYQEILDEMPDILQPSVTSPSDGAIDIGETPDIVLSTYYSLYGKTQKAIRVQVSDTSGDFSTPVFDKTVTSATDTVSVTAGSLNTSTTYYCRGQYQDIDDVWGDWSGENSFTTASTFCPVDITSHGPGPDCSHLQYDSTNDIGYYGYVGCGNEPTYDSGTSYSAGDIVNDGSDEFYYSKTDSNSGNALPAVGGENTDWKWIGNGILTDGPTVSSGIGLSAGTAFNDTAGWLKFYVGPNADCNKDGVAKVLFIAKETLRNNLSWDDIYLAGAVYGTGDNGTANASTGTSATQDAQVTYGGYTFKVRLLTGSATDPAAEGYDNQQCSDDAGAGSEWNDLLYRVHTDVPDCGDPTIGMPGGNETTRHGGPQDGTNWASYTNAELQVYYSDAGDGTYCWCQEQGNDTSRRVRRGGNGVAYFDTNTADNTNTNNGWRPVLEMIQP
jgi:hypothetical protein